ncbi:DUF262 domain-containing protein [Pontibacter sp. 13R65]|uniref:DUF262 domain-containing protein n=1 Tax=Pontibacter sp. 13R65 TaxID=3127458 RepID=UPI00301BC1A0
MTDKLILKTINELLGYDFYIPFYQRGYRWTSQQVNDLLNDIWAFAEKKDKSSGFYCLQPIVVKQKQWQEADQTMDGWEVIDGQQRLTTIYIVLSYLTKEFLKTDTLLEDYGKEAYTLRYETRPKSELFLKNITEDNSNIDYHHIWAAYDTVKTWFTNGENTKDRTDKNKFLDTLLGKKDDERSVQVIWYKVEPAVNSIELFTRLNIGKIPLTNAELIKALFLSTSSFENESPEDCIRRKMEISQIWDDIEQKLSDEHFWSFITNEKQNKYSTKIELLFDSIAGKKESEIDPLFTFLYFLKKSKDRSQSLWDLWLSIEQYYLTLCQWYKEKNLYHKIGYLISVGEDMGDLIQLSMNLMKNKFEIELDERIKARINKVAIEDLNYENKKHYKPIENLLLLFNVESIRSNDNIMEYYPFKFHKNRQWSLEHIHAQNSESLDKTKKESWFKWLNYHATLIEELVSEEQNDQVREDWETLLEEIKQSNNEKLTWDRFAAISKKIIDKFSDNSESHSDDLHSISNLALLSQPDNAALNNSVFEVKRREIINMDKNGNYIPLCTRRAFLKYYNNKPSTQQYYFWGSEDRNNYFKEIKDVLKNYIEQPTQILN